MKQYFPFLLGLGLSLCQVAQADEQTRNVQTTLKAEGFYYGPVNGENSQETSAAIRRYQIRNGLQVTGALNQETLDALSKSNAPSQESVAPVAPSTPVIPQTPQARHPQAEAESEEQILRTPPTKPQAPDTEEVLIPYSQLFKRSPFEHAPLPVQQQTFQRVQDKLVGKGFYRGRPEAQPTENMRRAIASYQEAHGLRVTGALDVDTLHELRMLPGESGSPFGTSPSRPERRIYRGIEVR